MNRITMTHEDGSKITIIRQGGNDTQDTIRIAKQCGYIKFEAVSVS